MKYRSTRGKAPELDFADVLLTGLAIDGGLYCPESIPVLPELASGASYTQIAQQVMWPFVEGSIDQVDFNRMVEEAYASFATPEVCPVVDLGGGHFLLDLTQGPTLAFKDVALQLVGRLLDYELGRRGETNTVVAATSGDTGSAAIEALKNRPNVRALVLHPLGRVSDVQRRQMTTVDAPNIRNLALEGTFDDCQDIVKEAFGDPELRAAFGLAAVNSINWARVMAQIVYYVTAARTVAPDGGPVSFCVPTGNFGNILAGWYAKHMGVNIDQLIVASNRNDVLTRFFETGRLTGDEVVPSLSPSMDIQVSSNFERMLWEASGRDSEAVEALLATFRAEGDVEVPAAWVETIRSEFDADRLDDEGTLATIRETNERLGLLIDPHTAVGIHTAQTMRRDETVPMVTLATAAPAKFPDAVENATGIRPELPAFLSELFDRTERYDVRKASLDEVATYLRTQFGY